MSDPGTRATDAAQAALERQMRKVYRQAQEEIIEKLNAHLKKFMAMDVKKRSQLAAGTITKEDYEHWLNGKVFIGKQWKDKVTSVAATLMDANKQANDMIEGKKRAVFGENASFQAYKLEHDAGMDLSFSVYDSATVTKLLNEHPELLPRKVVNGVKDQAWNRRKIANAVMQGIIQGEAIDEIADRIARQTGSQNMNAMTRYARTAMTGAQNAGRMETMHEAQDMGIKVKKRWIATLDSRTRDAHQDLDGQVQEVDKPFDSELGKIMYPGDPTAHPANVWNCRCTLGYVYDEYPERYAQRRAYVEYVDDNGEYHRESHEIANMSYRVWKLAKDRDNIKALEAWRNEKTPFTNDTIKGIIYGEKILRAVGGKSPSYPSVNNPLTGEPIKFVPGTHPIYPPDHTMAGKGCKTGRTIDELDYLDEWYQVGSPEKWQKEKALYTVYDDYGNEAYVELHYYQHPEAGKVEFKVKLREGRVYIEKD